MSNQKLMMHIRNAHPEDMKTILMIFPGEGIEKKEEIVELADIFGYTIIDKEHLDAFTTAKDLGLIYKDPSSKKFMLSPEGVILRKILSYKPVIFVDVVHGLQILLWFKSQKSPAVAWSWAYKRIVDLLWENGYLNTIPKKTIISEIVSMAQEVFGTVDMAFSPKSFNGALLWISQLHPPVINEESFKRRLFCPPELFLLAVDYVYRRSKTEYGVKLILRENVKEEICKMCLLDPVSFEKVLSHVELQFENLFSSQIGGGWGRYVTLEREPTLKDLLGDE